MEEVEISGMLKPSNSIITNIVCLFFFVLLGQILFCGLVILLLLLQLCGSVYCLHKGSLQLRGFISAAQANRGRLGVHLLCNFGFGCVMKGDFPLGQNKKKSDEG